MDFSMDFSKFFFSWLFFAFSIDFLVRKHNYVCVSRKRSDPSEIKLRPPSLKGPFTNLIPLWALFVEWTLGWKMAKTLIANRNPAPCVCVIRITAISFCISLAFVLHLLKRCPFKPSVCCKTRPPFTFTLKPYTLSAFYGATQSACNKIHTANQFAIVRCFLPHRTHLCVLPPLFSALGFCFLPTVLICWSHYGTLCPAVIVDPNDIRGSVVWWGVSCCV